MIFYKHLVLMIVTLSLLGLNTQKVLATDCDIFLNALSYFFPERVDEIKKTGDCCNTSGVTCDTNKKINNLKISNGLPHGQNFSIFFKELAKLNQLTSLEITSISGYDGSGIPPSIGNLKTLKTLIISNSHIFSSSLPDEIGNLTNLEKLDLSNDYLEGSIPSSLGNLTNLKYLNLEHNYFSGYIPYEFKNLTKLQVLNLHYNYDLKGYVPLLPNVKSCNYGMCKLCTLSAAQCTIGSKGTCSQNDIEDTNLGNGNPNPSSDEYIAYSSEKSTENDSSTGNSSSTGNNSSTGNSSSTGNDSSTGNSSNIGNNSSTGNSSSTGNDSSTGNNNNNNRDDILKTRLYIALTIISVFFLVIGCAILFKLNNKRKNKNEYPSINNNRTNTDITPILSYQNINNSIEPTTPIANVNYNSVLQTQVYNNGVDNYIVSNEPAIITSYNPQNIIQPIQNQNLQNSIQNTQIQNQINSPPPNYSTLPHGTNTSEIASQITPPSTTDSISVTDAASTVATTTYTTSNNVIPFSNKYGVPYEAHLAPPSSNVRPAVDSPLKKYAVPYNAQLAPSPSTTVAPPSKSFKLEQPYNAQLVPVTVLPTSSKPYIPVPYNAQLAPVTVLPVSSKTSVPYNVPYNAHVVH